ncbi:protein kinase domain-containing protein [Wenzhouxiangella sp. EGI_FJ10409]|uniref:protein kinase domain-containing protein n=1 Tax=Wenzhouxiangella sp. EGI_FJ10409 TaxID=3243767 RepID=UPI0035D80A5F
MQIVRLSELDRLLERILDGEKVDQSTLSGEERRLLEQLVNASGAAMPGLDSACGEHPDFASEISAAILSGDVRAGMRVGPFRLGERIGAGGMGVVFKAWRCEGDFEQCVALKLVGAAAGDPLLVRMFHRERSMLAQLEHPNIARLIDGGVGEAQRPWFAMEFIDGQPVHDYANQHKLSVRGRLGLLLQACDALEHAHRRLILHRDIKPANLLVDSTGMLRLVDFGLGRIFDPDRVADAETTIGAGRMTPDYASPEQARGEPVSLGSEVYQLGLVLHVLLTGELPYRLSGHTAFEIANTINQATIRPPSERWRDNQIDETVAECFREPPRKLRRALRGDLDNIVLTALARDSQARYATVAEFAADLRRHLEQLPVKARAATRRYRLSRFVQRNKAAVSGTAAFIGLLLASVVLLGMQSRQLATERDRAALESQRAQVETAKARQVRDYLVSLFEEASPLNDGGRDITAYELLQQGAASVDALDDEPEVQVEMLLSLAIANRNLLDFDQAAALLDRALARLKAMPDAPVADYAEVMMWRGRVAALQNDHQMALDYLNRANARLEGVAGRPVLHATSLRNLAITLANLREFERAESTLQQALAIYSDKRGFEAERHLIVNDLAAFYNFTRQPERALPMFEDVVAYRIATLGDAHPDTLHAQGNLAATAMDLGRLDQARSVFEALGPRMRELYGSDSDEFGRVQYRLGRIALEQGDYARSAELLAEARRIRRLSRGPDDGNLATIVSWQAALAERQGDLVLAVSHLEDALAIYDRIRPEPHPSKLELRISLGETLDRLGRRDDSLAVYVRAFQSLGDYADPFAVRTAEGLVALARDSLSADESERASMALDYARRAAEAATDTEQKSELFEQIDQLWNSIEP